MTINFKEIKKIFKKAEEDGRFFLLEHEVYQMVEQLRVPKPEYLFIQKGREVKKEELSSFSSEEIVIKIVSPLILHKSEVEGVRFVRKEEEEINQTIRDMMEKVPQNYLSYTERAEHSEKSLQEVKEGIKGVLLCEAVNYEKQGFGSELLLGVRNTREFGPVVTMGIGGLDVEYLNERLKEGKSLSISAAHLLPQEKILEVLKPVAFYDKITKPFRGRKALLSSKELKRIYNNFQNLGTYFSPFNQQNEYVIEEAEVNPVVIKQKNLIPLDGVCRFSKNKRELNARPGESIHNLLHPQSIGIIGVSEKMNIGHIILNNIIAKGFSPSQIYVVKPGVEEMEGCRCVPSVSELPQCVDMFVLAVSAEQSYEVMKELIEEEKARSVIIISGGIGEKEGTQSLEEDIKFLLSSGRERKKLTPVVNGGNCLGIYSRPGQYDTTFVPDYKIYKLPPTDICTYKLVYLSQSGAFMISRMSKIPYIDPLYAISVGNQIDLSVADYLNYFKQKNEVQILAVYMEGLLPAEGLAFARAAQEMVKQGKKILVYKAGRSSEGQTATSSHTASVAGDYKVAHSILRECGVIMAESLQEFENYIRNLCYLEKKSIKGNKVGLISNAGFESVIMCDSLKNEQKLELAQFSSQTLKKLSEILTPQGIERIQDVKNPLDVTPVADDFTFARCVELILEDSNVDCAVVSPVPMTPAMQTLEASSYHQEDLTQKGSIPLRLAEIFHKTNKPFLVNIDSGAIYDPMVNLLDKSGVPTFRHCDEAVKFLRQFVNS